MQYVTLPRRGEATFCSGFRKNAGISLRGLQSCCHAGVDMIDLNFGCPAKKIVSKSGGAALLKDLKLTESLFRAAVEAVDIPVSVKFRSGWDRESTNYIEVGKIAENCGVAMLTLHPRTKASGFKGECGLEQNRDAEGSCYDSRCRQRRYKYSPGCSRYDRSDQL